MTRPELIAMIDMLVNVQIQLEEGEYNLNAFDAAGRTLNKLDSTITEARNLLELLPIEDKTK